MFSKHKDMVAGVFLFLVGAVFFALSYNIRLTNIDRLVGSRLFPQAGAVTLMGLSLLMIIGSLIKAKKATPPTQSTAPAAPADRPVYRNTVLVLFSFAAYIYLLDVVGFTVATLAYLFTQMCILRGDKATGRTYIFYAVLTIVSTVIIYFMFNNVFYLILPRGKIF